MAKEVSYIGQVLAFDETRYTRTIWQYNKVMPLVNELAAHYESLGIGEFSQAVYDDILVNNVKNIKPRYDEMVEKGLDGLKIPVAAIREQYYAEAAKTLNIFSKKIYELIDLFNKRKYGGSSITAELPTQLENITIAGTRATLTEKLEAQIREHFTISIQTKAQEEAYKLFLQIKEPWDKLADFLKESGNNSDVLELFTNNNSILYTDEEFHLQFLGQQMNLIN